MLTRDNVTCVITVADNATETPDVSVQFKGGDEGNVSEPVVFTWFLSVDETAQALAVDTTDISEIAILTNGTILTELETDVMGVAITEDDGLADFTVTIVTTKQAVLNVVLPNGKLVQSDVMTYTA